MSGSSPISIPRPARTTASGSTTTTSRRCRVGSWLLALEDHAVLPIFDVYRRSLRGLAPSLLLSRADPSHPAGRHAGRSS
jgi:hypothetical protein